jgi:hypothetical protein
MHRHAVHFVQRLLECVLQRLPCLQVMLQRVLKRLRSACFSACQFAYRLR